MVASSPGHVEVQRTLDSIIIGARHRTDLGDIDALMDSIQREGLLQPITVTPDGALVCGRRRLEALRRLGYRTTNVWVRSGLTDRLSRLLAEQNDNALHKPLSLIEAESLYRELKVVLAEDAERRQAATRFGAPDSAGEHGGADSAPPSEERGKSRAQAARLVMGRNSYTMLEEVGRLKDLAHDETQPAHIRAQAAEEVARIEAGGKVHNAHVRMNTALTLDELDQIAADSGQPSSLREQAANTAAQVRAADSSRTADLERLAREAVARVKAARTGTKSDNGKRRGEPASHLTVVMLPPRAFVALWDDMAGWTKKYDPAVLAPALTTEQWERFEQVLTETVAFADRLREIRAATASAASAGDALAG